MIFIAGYAVDRQAILDLDLQASGMEFASEMVVKASISNVESGGSGCDLEGVPDASIDAIWSFDVFVHINRSEFLSYAKEFARVLKPGAVGIIQHGSCGGSRGGWRSDIWRDDVSEALRFYGAEIVDQLSSWQDEGRDFPAGLYGDVVTIFRVPLPAT